MKINKNNYFLFLYICVPFVATAFIELNKILTFSTVIFITLLFLFKKLSSKIIINNQYFEKFNKTNIGFLIFLLFIFTYLFQNFFLNYETITWDVASYLVAAQEIGRNHIPFETQWESKGPLFLYLYYFNSQLVSNNLVHFKLLNDLFIFLTSIIIFLSVYKISNKNKFVSTVSSLLFLLITSFQWYVSEFSEIYCLPLLGLVYYLYKSNLKKNITIFLIGFLFSLSTLINQGTILFIIPYLLLLYFGSDRKSLIKKYLFISLGFLIPHLFFIFVYFQADLIRIYFANYFSIPLSYTGSSYSSFSELLVVLRRIFKYDVFLYFSIICLIFFTILNSVNFRKKQYFTNIFNIENINIIFAVLFYFIAGHNYAHHLFYLIFYSCFLVYKLNYHQLYLVSLILSFSFISLTFKLFPVSAQNLTNTEQIYDNYPLRQLAQTIDTKIDEDDDILALNYVLVLYYLDKPNFSYIVHPSNHFEDYIVNELLKQGKIKTNEFNHVSYYIEQEPNVIMCNPTMIIRGNVEKTDFYNCGVGDYKKNYSQLDTTTYKNNVFLNLYKNPYEAINVYIKNE